MNQPGKILCMGLYDKLPSRAKLLNGSTSDHVHAAQLYTNVKDDSNKLHFLFPCVTDVSRREHLQTSVADIRRRIWF